MPQFSYNLVRCARELTLWHKVSLIGVANVLKGFCPILAYIDRTKARFCEIRKYFKYNCYSSSYTGRGVYTYESRIYMVLELSTSYVLQ